MKWAVVTPTFMANPNIAQVNPRIIVINFVIK